MVRINLLNPTNLTDQHLIAEYNEILKLVGHIKKHPKINNPPKKYCLGKGHINFFKDKLKYLKLRHKKIIKEMKNRKFEPKKEIKIQNFPKEYKNNYKPKLKDKLIIKKRLIQKIKQKPNYYRYYKKNKPKQFLINLIKKEK